jgi:hypothetical protein
MKTAMQLLFEEFESLSKASRNAGDIETAGLIDFLCERKAVALEKEKEQIIQAHKIGWEDCQEYIRTIGQTTRKGKKYYNQTYNQNAK